MYYFAPNASAFSDIKPANQKWGFIMMSDLQQYITNFWRYPIRPICFFRMCIWIKVNELSFRVETLPFSFSPPFSGLPLIIYFPIPWLFPNFSLTFYSFPYPLTDPKKKDFILYFNQGGHTLWKTGKMVKKIPCREKSGNLKFCWKSGKNQGN